MNRGFDPRVNATERTMTCRLRYFVRMNPRISIVSKVREDPQEFLNDVYNLLSAMGVTYIKKEELDSHQLREVAQVWCTFVKIIGRERRVL